MAIGKRRDKSIQECPDSTRLTKTSQAPSSIRVGAWLEKGNETGIGRSRLGDDSGAARHPPVGRVERVDVNAIGTIDNSESVCR
jgi:hypothetical protein